MVDRTIGLDKLARQEPVMFSIPNNNPGLARQRKREWYQRNKDEILKRKRDRRAAPQKTTRTATQTSTYHRADCENPRAQPTNLQPIPGHASGPSAFHQPSVLSPKPRLDSATTAGAASLSQTEQTPESVPKITCVGRRVLGAIVRVEPWIRQ